MTTRLHDIERYDSGAQFFRADIHIHSFGGSADVKDQTMTPEAIIEAAKAMDISIVAITDHNSDRNTKTSIDYAKKFSKELLVLAGAEITTANGHLLAYFRPERHEAVRDLLARIGIVGKAGERDSHTAMSMASVMQEVEKLGGICIAAHIDRTKTGFEAIVPGYPNWKKDIIASSALFGLEFDDVSHLSWYSSEDEPTSEGAERKKLLSARATPAATSSRVALAALQNSDAHTMADLKAGGELTRFKLNELSFDAFRTALIDPGARVRPTATVPPSVPRVIGVHFLGGFLDGQTIHFSRNLNCFIGGRGTGKSTAVRSLAYALGIDDELQEHDNCPDQVIIYAQDANGTLYRYDRRRGMDTTVQAKEDQSINDVPPDAFRIEFFGQGDLAEVAKDPLRHPALLQEFLDRHISTEDLRQREAELIKSLTQNSSQIVPLAALIAQLPAKKTALKNIDTKLTLAETGKVRQIAAFKTRVTAEKTLADDVLDIAKFYETGLSLENFFRDYDILAANAGTLTGDKKSILLLEKLKSIIEEANASLVDYQTRINAELTKYGKALRGPLKSLGEIHKELDTDLATKTAELRKQGLSGGVEELNTLLNQRTTLAAEIKRIEAREPELKSLQEARRNLLGQLSMTRSDIIERRKSQLLAINRNLSSTVKDYSVNLYYDSSGVIDSFKEFVVAEMHGTYFQEETAAIFCRNTTPQELAALIAARRVADVAKLTSEVSNWAAQIVQQLGVLGKLHQLETIWKPPLPVIKVLTKGASAKQIGVNELSDGQKHTILLAIAMLAESNLPLIIDQPEDDLDNAFIFDSVVATLRGIKERRQVILVTHNANIAVLGDSELILPMKRHGDTSLVHDRGSIDRNETKKAVQEILEGGEKAFRRRHAIYGY